MAFTGIDSLGIDAGVLSGALERHESIDVPRYERLWSYYRNEAPLHGSGRPVGSQAVGLPARLRGRMHASGDDRSPDREIVIENDIAWRIDALVDFVFGNPIRIVSTARDARVRDVVESVLDACWEGSGGTLLLQDMALLGAVYGSVDVVVRADRLADAGVADGLSEQLARGTDAVSITGSARAAGEAIGIELVDAVRSVPIGLTASGSEHPLDALCVWTSSREDAAERSSMTARVLRALRSSVDGSRVGGRIGSGEGRAGGYAAGARRGDRVEVFGAERVVVYEDGERVSSAVHGLDVVPVVRIPNRPVPARAAGLSEVEPLIPLQDELNTRLSDRAHRVTMQSFRMYLAKGIDGFADAAVGPGQVWSTDNPDADVRAFGGDVYTPSEHEHIQQVRDAMDKLSGVSPLVLGLLRARIGHLSSENALRVTLMGVLSKSARKRLTYGRGIAQVSRLVLRALSNAGVLDLDESEMGIRIEWPDSLPVDEVRRLQSARLKLDIGVDRDRVLEELGYAPVDAGIV